MEELKDSMVPTTSGVKKKKGEKEREDVGKKKNA